MNSNLIIRESPIIERCECRVMDYKLESKRMGNRIR